jgi:fatty-acyl-CoA synthase
MAKFETVQDIIAFEQTPLAERNLSGSTYDVFTRASANSPDSPALTFFLQGTDYKKTVEFSHRQLLGKINQAANMFADLGIGPTDTVSYILPNLPQTFFTLYGGEAAGIANPINPMLEAHTIAEIMNAAETKLLVTIAPFPKSDVWEKVAAIADDVPTLQTILRVDIAGYLGGIKKFAVNWMRRGQGKEQLRARVLDFDKTAVSYPTDRLTSGRTITGDEVAAYFHTGGTTGTPKLASHSHTNEVFDASMVVEWLDAGKELRNYLGLPLFHNYGAIAVGLGAWVVGGAVIMGTPQGFRGEGVIENMWKILDYHQCTIFSGVPTLFSALLNVPIGDNDLSKLKAATCGAAPLPVEVAKQFTAATAINILEGYGLTEGTSVSAINPFYGEQRIGSIGYRLPYQEMKTAVIAGGEFVRFCQPDEVGVVIVRGPNVFSGYRDDFHNKGAFVDTGDGGDRWLNTGDMGREDADGYFWLTGRIKELIIRGGHNIDPKQIEEKLHEHPAVALTAAVGRPDQHAGELPVVYVQLKPNAEATEEELMAFAKTHIGERAAVPKRIYIREQLPLTAVGKMYKPALLFEQVEDVLGAELEKVDDISTFSIKASNDKRLGTVVRVQIEVVDGGDKTAVEQAAHPAHLYYSIHADIQVTDNETANL